MKKFHLFFVVLVVFLLASCTTIGQVESPYDYSLDNVSELFSGFYSDNEVEVIATAMLDNEYERLLKFTTGIEVVIKNKSNKVFSLDYNQSVFVLKDISIRVVDGESRVIDSQKTQPLYPIAPKTSICRLVCNADSDFGFAISDDVKLVLALTDGQYTKYVHIDFSNKQIKDTNIKLNKVGTVSIDKTVWHFFFTGDSIEKAVEELEGKAKEKYGPDAVINNIKYKKSWSALSLALYFDIFGYVDKITAEADVCIPLK